jgi:hypothetical protein
VTRTLPLTLLCLALLPGCGASAPPSTDAGLADAGPPTWASVEAVLSRSCAFTSCHGALRAYPRLSQEFAYASLTTGMSMQIPSLRLVAPGNPAQSWLMHKLDGTLSSQAVCAASNSPCGVSMPQGSELLPAHERAMIRAWIEMGAPGPRDR